MKLDFKNFHKIECDDRCTTLQHENGHIIKIVHKNLSPEHRSELEELPLKLAKGGRAKFSQMYDPNIAGSKASRVSKSSNTMPGSPASATKAYTEPGDQGTGSLPKLDMPPDLDNDLRKPKNMDTMSWMLKDVKGSFSKKGMNPPCLNSSCKSYGKPHPNCKCYGGEHYLGMSDGGKVGESQFCSENRPHEESCQYFKDKGLVEPEVNLTAQDIDPNALIGSSQSIETNPNPEGQGNDWQGSYGVSQPTQEQTPEVPASQPEEQVPQVENTVSPTSPSGPSQLSPVDHAAAVTNWVSDHDKKMQADLNNGWIKPETYADLFHDKSTLGKIGTIFGMLIGGAGAGLSHQPNMLMEMMNNTIQNDLNAQQKSVDNRQNLVKLAQQGILNDANAKHLNVATDVARQGLSNMMANRIALDHLAKLGNKLSGPALQAHNQMLVALAPMVDKENASIAGKVGIASAMAQQANPQQGGAPNTAFMESFGTPEMQQYGHQIDQRSLPGEDLVKGQIANKPLVQGDIDHINAMNTLDRQAKYLMQFAGKHFGSLDPKVRAAALQQAHEMAAYYGNSLGINQTEGGRTWLDDQVAAKNPTSALGQLFGSQDKLKEIIRSNQSRKVGLLNKMGFTPQQFKMSGGKKYKRGPKGEAIEVP